jgi:hypothetical protein
MTRSPALAVITSSRIAKCLQKVATFLQSIVSGSSLRLNESIFKILRLLARTDELVHFIHSGDENQCNSIKDITLFFIKHHIESLKARDDAGLEWAMNAQAMLKVRARRSANTCARGRQTRPAERNCKRRRMDVADCVNGIAERWYEEGDDKILAMYCHYDSSNHQDLNAALLREGSRADSKGLVGTRERLMTFSGRSSFSIMSVKGKNVKVYLFGEHSSASGPLDVLDFLKINGWTACPVERLKMNHVDAQVYFSNLLKGASADEIMFHLDLQSKSEADVHLVLLLISDSPLVFGVNSP